MIATIFPVLDSTDITIIMAIIGAVGGAGWRVIRWSQTKGEQLIAFTKPKVEEFFHSHVRLANTAEQSLKEMTGHVGKIQSEINGVHTTLNGHGTILQRLDTRCEKPTTRGPDA